MKQIIVNVSGLSEEEKQRVNEALAKITGARKIPLISNSAGWFFAPVSPLGAMMVTWGPASLVEKPTHTPQQVLEMAGMAKQGHIHAENMALYAEDAKTTDKPWELWQFKGLGGVWVACRRTPLWQPDTEYRRKPKTHIVHGVEVPDLRIDPNEGEEYYMPNPVDTYLYLGTTCNAHEAHDHRKNNNLCYENTEEGKQAAILHAKAWLGIA